MTPAARIAAAIAILDEISSGEAAEKALTLWARGNRFAGSKDRAAIRDHVFDVLRRKGSLSSDGASTGRDLMMRLAKVEGWDVAGLFDGTGYGPASLSSQEQAALDAFVVGTPKEDIPGWLWPAWVESLGDQAEEIAAVMQSRAGLFLRVNQRRCTVAEAADALAQDGVETASHPTVNTCLIVTENERRVRTSRAYADGLVEIQDAASQAAVARIPVPNGARVLDYCAGGGGKALALADQYDCDVTAHDISVTRMGDLPNRAERAGVAITIRDTAGLAEAAPFDVVVVDAPCSGSGTWRRTPDAKWQFSEDKLRKFRDLQIEVLAAALKHCRPGGILAYMTCSVLNAENIEVIARFQNTHPAVETTDEMRLVPSVASDGFYLNVLRVGD